MQKLLAAALGIGLVAAAAMPAFACGAHVAADGRDKPVTTADTGNGGGTPPPATDRQG